MFPVNLFHQKTFDLFLIACKNIGIFLSLSQNAGIQSGIALIIQLILKMKVHHHHLRNVFFHGQIHGQHIIFIKSGDTHILFHTQTIPFEKSGTGAVALDQVATDHLQHIRILQFFITSLQNPKYQHVKLFGLRYDRNGLPDHLFREYTFFYRITKHSRFKIVHFCQECRIYL